MFADCWRNHALPLITSEDLHPTPDTLHPRPDTCSPARYNPPVRIISRQKAIYFFLTLGVCLAAVAFAVGSGWIILNWRQGIKVFLGIIFFGAIVAGLVRNPIFLVRAIARNTT